MNTIASTAAVGDSTDRRLRIAVGVLTLIGIGIASYLTYVHYAGIKIACLAGGGGCETVQASTYSKLAGIPVSVLGLLGYVGIFGTLWIRGELGRIAGFGIALLGFLFSLYLTYRELFTIKAICQWCVGSATLMTLLMILTAVRVIREGTDQPAGLPPRAERRRRERAAEQRDRGRARSARR